MKSIEELQEDLKIASKDCEKLRKDLKNRESDMFVIQNAIFKEQKVLKGDNEIINHE